MLLSRKESILDKLMSRTIIVDRGYMIQGVLSPCWEWTGATSGNGRGGGYGRMCLDGQTVATHLVGYTHYNGYIPKTKHIDHLCHNRLCWNPTHLELVTHKQNQKRRAKRAREQLQNTGAKAPPGIRVLVPGKGQEVCRLRSVG